MNQLKVLASIAVAGLALSYAGVARAENYWSDMPGCAKQITVGSDDRPWVVGCDAMGTIFYLGKKTECFNGLCLSFPDWKRPPGNGLADFIAVNMSGHPMVSDRSGELWVGIWQNTGGKSPWELDPATKFWGWKHERTVTNAGATACFRSFSVAVPSNSLWAIGCGGNPEATIWRMKPSWQNSSLTGTMIVPGTGKWFQVGAEQGDAAHKITQFSTVSADSVTQNPWAVAVGLLFVYNGSSFDYVPTPADGSVTYATDGYVVAGGSVYKWNGNIYGRPAATPWTKIIGPTPLAPIYHIALSGKLVGGNVRLGPSRLWATDTSGRIYVLAHTSSTDPR